MKVLYGLLVLSLLTVLVALCAMWWRLRRHLRQSDQALKATLKDADADIDPRREEATTRPSR